MKPKLEVCELGYSYHTLEGETQALSQISFSVHSGEFLVIAGPSGCGKSTMLSLLSGLLKPESGSIHIDGVPLAESHAKIGYMLQKDHLFEWRTIYQNVSLGLEIQKKLTPEAEETLAQMLRTYGLHGFETARPSELSGGMRQRAALIRTLALEPDLLLLDEPFSALDSFLRERLRLELEQLLGDYDGVSVLVTHDRDEAYQLCSHLLLLDEGKVLAAGNTREVFADPGTVKAARLTGCKNISRIRRLGPHRVCALDWGGLELVTGQPVGDGITAVGIRAHDFIPLGEEENLEPGMQPADNRIPVTRPKVTEMPFEWYVTLENGIWWKKEKDIHTHDSSGIIPSWLYVDPAAVLLLR